MILTTETVVLVVYRRIVMKKRIISGVVMAAIVALVLTLGLCFENKILTIFISLLAALGVAEFVGNAAKVENNVFKSFYGREK